MRVDGRARGWRAHADFMNELVAEGFILLGGPLEGTRDVLLIVRAENEAEVEARLAPDVWRGERLAASALDRALDLAIGDVAIGLAATLDARAVGQPR